MLLRGRYEKCSDIRTRSSPKRHGQYQSSVAKHSSGSADTGLFTAARALGTTGWGSGTNTRLTPDVFKLLSDFESAFKAL